MKIEIEVPDGKFANGDVVRIQNTENKLAIIVHINGKQLSAGTWRSDSGAAIAHNVYTDAVVQEGYYNHTDAVEGETDSKIRPGTIFSALSVDEVDRNGTKIAWDKPIITPDDMINSTQRKIMWEKTGSIKGWEDVTLEEVHRYYQRRIRESNSQG